MTTRLRTVVRYIIPFGLLLSLMWAPATSAQTELAKITQWENPFEATLDATNVSTDSLTLSQALSLVAQSNPTLRAGRKKVESAAGLVIQAGLRPNPKLEIETEEVSGDASGFAESEINITVSQEFELWGKRQARKNLAQSEVESVKLEALFADYDLYASTVRRFFAVAHAQKRVSLSLEASSIARSIVQTAKNRVSKGAALQSEALLGELEFERTQLNLSQAESHLQTARERLSSLWSSPMSDFAVQQPRIDLEEFSDTDGLQSLIDNSRTLYILNRQEEIIKAQLSLERANSKPGLTFRGGLKRLETDNSNTFIFGVSLPLPFFDRNQGSIASLKASVEALKLERERALTEAETEFHSRRRKLSQLVSRFRALNSSLLPKSEEAYDFLKSAYDSGRIPYSILLEAQRTLIELRFELNDTYLAISQEAVSLKLALGITSR